MSASSVELSIRAAKGALESEAGEGPLVTSWLTPADAEALRRDGDLPPGAILPMIAAAKVRPVEAASLAKKKGLTLEVPAPEDAEAVALAVFDPAGAFWATLLDGRPGALMAIGDADEPTTLKLKPPPERKRAKAGKPRDLAFPGPAGTPVAVAGRHPPGAGKAPRPCVYLLPGLGGDETVRLQDRAFVEAMDARGPWAPVLAGVSTRTPAGSAYLSLDDPAWADALADALPAAADQGLRTLPSPDQRVLAGQSTGAFTALSLAMMRPGRFAAVVASAPDALDFEAWLLDGEGKIAAPWLAWMRLEASLSGPGQMRSLAASWSPDPDGAPQWPVDLATGEIRPDILDRWRAHSPLRLLERPEMQGALRDLDGRLWIGAARRDEFGVFEATRRFSERLDALGVRHQFVVDEASHFDAGPRLAALVDAALDSLPAFSP